MAQKRYSFVFYACILIALGLSFTPFYSLGYLVLIVTGAVNLTLLTTLPTFFGRIIISVLLLLATIMLVGLLFWLLKLDLHSFYVALAYVALIVMLAPKTADSKNIAIFDKKDLYATILGIFLPLLLLANYFLPHYSNASLYQILSNGWDHSSHVFMIETVAEQNSYAYAKESGNSYESTASAYPQAWHLSSAHLLNGFGQNLFDTTRPINVLKAYLATVVMWYFLSAYLLSRISLHIYTKIRLNTKMPKTILLLSLSLSTLIVQTITVFGAFNLGFANFIGLMTYMLLFAAIVLQEDKGKQFTSSYIIFASITCTAATLCWFLPFPALLLSLFMYFAHLKAKIRLATFLRHNITSLSFAVMTVLACVVQIFIFIFYSGVSGAEQLNAVGGAYKNSPLFISLVLLVCCAVLYKKHRSSLFQKLIILIAPLAFLLVLVLLYQTILTGEQSYYYYKLLTLLTLYVGIIFIPITALGAQKLYPILRRSMPLASFITFVFLGLLLIGTQQPLDSLGRILQRNSRVAYSTAQVMTDYLEQEDLQKTKLVALTFRGNEKGPRKNDVYNGDLVSRVTHLKPTCVFYVMNSNESKTYSARIKRLEQCAKKTSDTIIVITNKPTESKVRSLGMPNIRIINVR